MTVFSDGSTESSPLCPRERDAAACDASPPPRRRFLTAAAGAAAVGLLARPAAAREPKSNGYHWRMALSWDKNLRGMGTGSLRLANRITAMTNGELTVTPYGAGEICGAYDVFERVSRGEIEMAHTAAYYWRGKCPASSFFCAVPGGMTADQYDAWIFFGGGLALWQELYAPYRLISFPSGNTGAQPGGWYRREIRSIDDFRGLRMRIPGLAIDVVARLGAAVIDMPQPELSDALRSDKIDAVEWTGPWNDYDLGFHKVTKLFYGPGFHEGSTSLECMLHKPAYDALPDHLQKAVRTACAAENSLLRAEYKAQNAVYFQKLIKEEGVRAMHFPPDVMRALFKTSREVVDSVADIGPLEARIVHSYRHFQRLCLEYAPYSDFGYVLAMQDSRA